MEEREALKRQIELLQNLINTHKSVHGDAPNARVEQRHPEASTLSRGRGHSSSVIHPQSSRGRGVYDPQSSRGRGVYDLQSSRGRGVYDLQSSRGRGVYDPQSSRGRGVYDLQSRGSWKKTYSLRNKTPQSSVGPPSASTSSSGHQSVSTSAANSTSLPSHSRGEESDAAKGTALSSVVSQHRREGRVENSAGSSGVITEKKNTFTQSKAAGSEHDDGEGGSGSTVVNTQHQTLLQQGPEHRRAVLPEKKVSVSAEVPSSPKAKTSTDLNSSPLKPPLSKKTSTESKHSNTSKHPANLPTGHTGLPLSAPSKIPKQLAVKPAAHSSHSQVSASYLKKSKFTWVKSRNVEGAEAKQASSVSSPAAKAVTVAQTSTSKVGVAVGSSPLLPTGKRTPNKKLPRKLSPVTVAPKTSKYRWVSSSVGSQTKIYRKSTPPKALEKREAAKKVRTPSAPSAKFKKGTAGSPSGSSPSSRYRWKAGGQSSFAAVQGGTSVVRRKSAFHWTSDKSCKSVKGGLVSPPCQRTSFTPSPGGFKLRSRMKIIRKSATNGGGSASKVSPRSRIYSSARSPTGVRRTPSRELVSFGLHKLRRLSPTLSRTSHVASSSSSSSSSSSNRSPHISGCSGHATRW
ncbi:zinc finger CCCH domain-containing protein 3 [Labrus bergylta]|uniref:zinc finger CCCH domain-containing protein 3 n=1 Tax=Labrus bergylta TaxID=56723 RepID=UPI003313BE0B